jgi:hypothetical protein
VKLKWRVIYILAAVFLWAVTLCKLVSLGVDAKDSHARCFPSKFLRGRVSVPKELEMCSPLTSINIFVSYFSEDVCSASGRTKNSLVIGSERNFEFHGKSQWDSRSQYRNRSGTFYERPQLACNWNRVYAYAYPMLYFTGGGFAEVFDFYHAGWLFSISQIALRHTNIGSQRAAIEISDEQSLIERETSQSNCGDNQDVVHSLAPAWMQIVAFIGLGIWFVGLHIICCTNYARLGKIVGIIGIIVMAVGLSSEARFYDKQGCESAQTVIYCPIPNPAFCNWAEHVGNYVVLMQSVS